VKDGKYLTEKEFIEFVDLLTTTGVIFAKPAVIILNACLLGGYTMSNGKSRPCLAQALADKLSIPVLTPGGTSAQALFRGGNQTTDGWYWTMPSSGTSPGWAEADLLKYWTEWK